ncbi:hypothetical protein [Thermoflavimicrobium dichotomicum]|uniref:Uncharacterized protein n=1 Tax=Thermoflavimicrobium dichotomicum TaxID=46223 RepID=A0A1I3V6C4_9BACL|nr:hypothetical protein [Thermoflavimicrobium dichotomicum]SFJ89737.1 hypothetical protein SAMN05421852_13311 [Thermoflavimicrobium dichotomicum]
MEGIAAVLLLIFIAVVIVVNVFYRMGKKKEPSAISYILPDLGIQKHNAMFESHMKSLLEHLRASYPPGYVERVRERVIREHQISLVEWEHRWFEWERYLMMTAILRSVPMFSRKVDDVWHEMLMFTREYKEFSERYLKNMLHHIPNDSEAPFNPGERAWFDFIYVLLFQPTHYSQIAWGPFLRHPLSLELLNDFQRLSPDLLKKKYFNEQAAENLTGVAEIISFLIQFIHHELVSQKNFTRAYGTYPSTFYHRYLKGLRLSHPSLSLLVGGLYLSAYHHDHFYQEYEKLYKEIDEAESKTGSYGSDGGSGSDGGYVDSSGNGDSSSDGGGDSSGCSSCGGGCGGGGGD